jgi:Xaa-Pro aminopeptidase
MNTPAFRKRVANLREHLNKLPCDTAWIIQPENRRYLSGFRAEDYQFTELSGSLLINKTQAVLVTDSRYSLEAEKEAIDFDIYTTKQGLIEELPEVLIRMGTETLGFEEDHLTWGLHRQLAESLGALSPPISLNPLNGLVEDMREIKDNLEIKALEASADAMSEILDTVIRGLKPGLTEREVAWQIETLAREAGAESLSFPSIVASGPNSALPHAVPTDRALQTKEPIILDVGVRLDTYRSDMTRTVFIGEPEPDLKNIYMTVRKAQLAALKEIRPGIDSYHPDAIARQMIREAGFGKYFGHGLGHGVGLATHERPRLAPQKPVKLRRGMVVTVEPGIYIPGKGGVRLEEMVVIEAEGPRILTKNSCFYDFES